MTDFASAFDRLIAAMRVNHNASDMMDEAFVALLGINRTDGRCLDIAQRLGRITAGELARQMGLTTGAVTVVIDRLEQAGYLRRVPDPRDRRKVLVEITETAADLAHLVYAQMTRVGQDILSRMPAQDLDLITRFLSASAVMHRAIATELQDTRGTARSSETPRDIAERFDRRLAGMVPTLKADLDDAVQQTLDSLKSGWPVIAKTD